MKQLNREFLGNDPKRHEKILQFGEGNFLRAFIDLFIQQLNEKGLFNGDIVIVQPIKSGLASVLNKQEGCYTVVLRGLENGKPVVSEKIVSCVSRAINPFENFTEYMETMENPHLRYIVSNTTEAGITYQECPKPSDTEPPQSFPAKVTALLYQRYNNFKGDPEKGFIFIPCELIDNNGTQLKECITKHAKSWSLPGEFINWINQCNHFTNTLVDRIVTGYPKDEASEFATKLGYQDDLLVTGEIFHFMAIEAGEKATAEINKDMPFKEAGLNVILTKDATPYKIRKVRILNGAHTMSVLAAFLSGKDTVGEMTADPVFANFLKRGIYDEIIPTINMSKDDLLSFADAVFDRFANPYIKHYLTSIALNSVSKFKARVLPVILDYENDCLPKVLTFSFAALIAFYKGTEREGYSPQDTEDVIEFFKTQWHTKNVVNAVLSNKNFWDTDLTEIPKLADTIYGHLRGILENGVKAEMEKLLNDA